MVVVVESGGLKQSAARPTLWSIVGKHPRPQDTSDSRR
ncbi:hypothetical protein HNP29_004407 [Pseudomonas alcaligenes]|nr:hypothetical protein [Pseudomonas alcaligenes]